MRSSPTSPSAEACRLNERLGFHTVTDCTLFYPLPLKALRPSSARLITLASAQPGTLTSETREMLEDHARLGCIVAIMQADGRHYPLVFLKTATKGRPPRASSIARTAQSYKDTLPRSPAISFATADLP